MFENNEPIVKISQVTADFTTRIIKNVRMYSLGYFKVPAYPTL